MFNRFTALNNNNDINVYVLLLERMHMKVQNIRSPRLDPMRRDAAPDDPETDVARSARCIPAVVLSQSSGHIE